MRTSSVGISMLIASALRMPEDEGFSSDEVISKRDWEDTNDCTKIGDICLRTTILVAKVDLFFPLQLLAKLSVFMKWNIV